MSPPPLTPTPNALPAANDLPNSPPIPENPTTNPRFISEDQYYFNQLIGFDAIRPIYEPEFVNAAESPYRDDELVMGVTWDGKAKAYSVTVLRFREMVNDELAGIPTLVTW